MHESTRYYRGSIDSHLHLSLMAHKQLDPHSVLDAAEGGGLDRVIDVGVKPTDLEERLARFAANRLVAFTVGLHPTAVEPDAVAAELDALQAALEKLAPRIVAVGELGLDFYWSQEHRDLQLEALERQWELAARHGLPVIIHNRDSEQTMLELLRAHRPAGIMHCFSQDAAYCRACLDAGLMISFGGNLTYPKSDGIREAARIVPDDRLLVETDSPYLSPQAVRGTANHPGHLGFVIDELARLRGATPQEIADLTAANARALFGLPPNQ
ncbi:MAG: TatD family hydrolase [Spirochaetota bacterium]